MWLFFQTWIAVRVELEGMGGRGWCFERTGLYGERRIWVMSSQEPLPCTSFLISYVRFFFLHFLLILHFQTLSRLLLYSTSSASSPWSPSISKAAYLLAELNFWKIETKQTPDQYSSFGCFQNWAYTREKMSSLWWSMKKRLQNWRSMSYGPKEDPLHFGLD